jgi:hypothetical protein
LEPRIVPGFIAARAFDAGVVPYSVALGDFNGDGISDLAVANKGTNASNGSVSVLLGNGDGTFQPAVTYAVGTGPDSVAVGDFIGDGIPDLAVANYGGNVSVLLGNGDGTFQPARAFPAGSSLGSVAVADFNDDGIPDLAVAGTAGGVRVLLGNGDGTFQTSNVSYVTGNDAISMVVGDFNGDGLPDLAVANLYSSDVSILLNDGAWTGPVPTPRTGAAHDRRFPGRSIDVPKRPAFRNPAAAVGPQLAEAAVPELRRAAPAAAAAEPAPVLPLRASGRPASSATPAPSPHREESPPPTRARPAPLAQPALLDVVFTNALAAGSDANLADDRGPLSA